MRTRLVAALATVLAALSLGLFAAPASAVDNSSTTVGDTASGVSVGGNFSFNATVSGPGVTPTGTVTWMVTDPNDQTVTCPPSTLDNGVGTCTVTNAIAGMYSGTADYSGDSNYTTSSGQDTPSISQAGSSTTVGDTASGVSVGGNFSFNATVSGPGVTPTGTVTWMVTDPNDQTVTCPPSTLDNGVGTCTVTNAIAGMYSGTADYSGDSNYTTSSGQDTPSISQAGSSTTVGDTASGVSVGGNFSFNATVSGPGVTPTGTVTWMVTDPNDQTVTCPPSTLDNGVGTCTVTNAIAGMYSGTADYSGDSNYTTSSGQDTPSISQAGSSTTVGDTASGVSVGGNFSFNATVSGPGVTPTGTVTWMVTDPNDQTVTCPPSTLDNGVGTCTVTNAIAGMYSGTADYSGDSNYTTSSGQDPGATVSKAPLSMVPALIDVSRGTNWDDTELTGAVAQVTATLTGASGITPTGSVTYVLYTSSNCSTGGAALGTFMIAGDGTVHASNETGPLNAGRYSDQVTYSGDTNYVSQSQCHDFTVAQNAAPSPPSISNIPGAGMALFGGNFTPTVSTVTDGAPSTTSSTTGVCVVLNATVAFVGVGTCALTAHTGGTPNYGASTGSPQSFTVARATPSSPTISNIPTAATEFGTFVAAVSTTGDGATSVASISTAVCVVAADAHTVTFVGFGVCTLTASVAQGPDYLAATGNTRSFPVGPAARGYWLVGSDGGIFSFGAAAFYGSMGSIPLQRPVVGITPSASRTGYWLVASDGGIFSFGTSSFYGSIPQVGLHPAGSGLPHSLNAPIVAMVPSVTGHGYFMVASDGGVFAFGDAHFAGSCPGIGGCVGRAVAVMPDSTGMGYWLVTNVGAIYAFGDATFYGAPSASSVSVVDAVATPDWHGYWLLYSSGMVAGFGDASVMGAPLGYVNSFNPATSIFPTADGKGYWVAAARGDVFSYGDAPYLGSMAAAGLNGQIIAAFGF